MRPIDFLSGIFFSLFGLFFVVFHSKISRFAIDHWYKKFPNIKIWERGYDFCVLAVGLAFVVFGLLLTFQIIKPR